jgi:TolA-binding protein
MAMRNAPFLIFTLALFSAFACGHYWLKARLAGDDRAWVARLEKLSRESGRWRLEAELAQYELADWRQHVATLVPSALERAPDEASAYPLRDVASIAAGDVASRLEIEPASSLFERSKEDFRGGRFDASIDGFKALLERFPSSRHGIEARFLLSEAQYQQKDFEGAVDSIEALVGNFPESELTGFALLSLGRIYEEQDRKEDAAEVYGAILKAYSNAELVAKARALLKKVDL